MARVTASKLKILFSFRCQFGTSNADLNSDNFLWSASTGIVALTNEPEAVEAWGSLNQEESLAAMVSITDLVNGGNGGAYHLYRWKQCSKSSIQCYRGESDSLTNLLFKKNMRKERRSGMKTFTIVQKILTCPLICILFLVNVPSAFSVDRFVSRTYGRDIFKPTNFVNNCTDSINPCKTIVHTLRQSSSGDTIKTDVSEYNENLVIEPSGSLDLNIQGGWNKDFDKRYTDIKSMLRVSQGNVLKIDADGVNLSLDISGFIISGGSSRYGGGVYILSRNGGDAEITLNNNN